MKLHRLQVGSGSCPLLAITVLLRANDGNHLVQTFRPKLILSVTQMLQPVLLQ
jgi:hypothetical protein